MSFGCRRESVSGVEIKPNFPLALGMSSPEKLLVPIGLCREPSSRPQDGSLRSRTGGFVDTRPRAVVGKQDGLMPVLGRAA